MRGWPKSVRYYRLHTEELNIPNSAWCNLWLWACLHGPYTSTFQHAPSCQLVKKFLLDVDHRVVNSFKSFVLCSKIQEKVLDSLMLYWTKVQSIFHAFPSQAFRGLNSTFTCFEGGKTSFRRVFLFNNQNHLKLFQMA